MGRHRRRFGWLAENAPLAGSTITYDGLYYDWHRSKGLTSLHAVREPRHFTQSAGMVAITRDAHNRCREGRLVSLLQLIAALKFGYDPENRFSTAQMDEYGFMQGHSFDNVYERAIARFRQALAK